MSIDITLDSVGVWGVWFVYPWGDMDVADRCLPLSAKDRVTNVDSPLWDDLGFLLARA